MTEAIVSRALICVAQHLVRFARFLKLFFSDVVARVTVGMILQRLLAVGALQLLVAYIARNAQYFVVVSFSHVCTQVSSTAFTNQWLWSLRPCFKPHYSLRSSPKRRRRELPLLLQSLVCFEFEATRTSAGRSRRSRNL